MPNRFQHQAGSTMTPKLHSALSRFFTIPNWIDRIEATDVADGLDDIRTAFREAIDEKQLSGGTPEQVMPAPGSPASPTNIGVTMSSETAVRPDIQEVLYSSLKKFFALPNWENRVGPYTDVADRLAVVHLAFIAQEKGISTVYNPTPSIADVPLVDPPSALEVLREYLLAAIDEVKHKGSTSEARYTALTEILRVVNLISEYSSRRIDTITTARQ